MQSMLSSSAPMKIPIRIRTNLRSRRDNLVTCRPISSSRFWYAARGSVTDRSVGFEDVKDVLTDMPQAAERGRNSDDRRGTNISQSGRSMMNAAGVSLIPVNRQSHGVTISRRRGGDHFRCFRNRIHSACARRSRPEIKQPGILSQLILQTKHLDVLGHPARSASRG